MRAGRPASSDTSQAQVQGFELTHPSIYPIGELLECTKHPVLQTQNYRTPMTGQRDVPEESQGGSPLDRAAEARGLTPDQGVTAVNICKHRGVDKGCTVGHTATHYGFHSEMFSTLCFVNFFSCFLFSFRGRLQGQKGDTKGWGNEWNWGV